MNRYISSIKKPTKYLIGASGSDLKSISYISGLNPINWSDNIMDSKLFTDYEEARDEIIKDIETFKDIILYTDMNKIFIMSFSTGNLKTIINEEGNINIKEFYNDIS